MNKQHKHKLEKLEFQMQDNAIIPVLLIGHMLAEWGETIESDANNELGERCFNKWSCSFKITRLSIIILNQSKIP